MKRHILKSKQSWFKSI